MNDIKLAALGQIAEAANRSKKYSRSTQQPDGQHAIDDYTLCLTADELASLIALGKMHRNLRPTLKAVEQTDGHLLCMPW